MARLPIIQHLYFPLLQKHMFNFDKANAELEEITSTWTFERSQLLKRICEIRGEETGPLSPKSLESRHEATIEALRQDMMRR